MELRPYQKEDLQFLARWKRVALFNEQRTGKTPTTLKLLEHHNLKKILIICPASAIYQWSEEYKIWLGEPCIALEGPKNKKLKMLQDWTNGLVISYDSFKATKKSNGLLSSILELSPEAVVLDEAHRIKNPKGANAQSVFKTIQIPHRIALTGTPAPNKAHEIYSILYWLYPEEFKSYWKFINHFFETKKESSGGGRSYIDIGGFQKGKDLKLQKILSTFSTLRKRKEVMPWLPDKDYQQVKLPVSVLQKKYLSELKKFFETEDVIVQGVLDRLIRYRQICLHPALLGLKGESPKLEWILDYLSDYPDTPTIIFSKFTSFIKILQEHLHGKNYGVIIGITTTLQRNNAKQQFQKGLINLLLINIDAGKEALTLDRAETVIFCDKYPPVGDIQQAEDRFVSTTEDKANKPHKIIELMMKGTYDEELYKLLKQRTSETDIINNYKKYLERST